MNEYPALIITPVLSDLYRSISSNGLVINVCYNVEDTRDFLRKYRGVHTNYPIVFSDIANIANYQSLLLKFVEEQESPLFIF